ncbi:ABC transporter ATP-binding protein [Cryptosporangium phraense]|uniref:ABC transporter ATP-binding protein n=1 Tax=Cryptosporangium phraense TaxID=2593070 RepID=A0A545ALZ8_9ACTN|nr:ABC transporter ATP-binding protein [Cryptosporangium phraense]
MRPLAAAEKRGAPAVEVSGLVKRYGEKVAVDDLSFAVPRGSVFAILGPNGAGKTSTVETCEGFRRADGGTARVLGLDPVRDATALRPRVGVMLQAGGGAYPGARTAEMLHLVASYSRNPIDPGLLLDLLGLTPVARTTVKRLSGGQQQRLSLAMAVVGRPELVFLDEPTAGLDPQARHVVWQIVEALRADGVTTVLTTHYMDEAERLADEVLIIDAGQAVAQGTPAALTRGEQPTLRFRADAELDAEALLTLTATLPSGCVATSAGDGGYQVTGPPSAIGPQLLAAVTAWCADRAVMPSDLQVGRRTLEDVFLDLTGRELR